MKHAKALFLILATYQAGLLFYYYTAHPASMALLIMPLITVIFIYKNWIEEKELTYER